jgi:hypothetical protein
MNNLFPHVEKEKVSRRKKKMHNPAPSLEIIVSQSKTYSCVLFLLFIDFLSYDNSKIIIYFIMIYFIIKLSLNIIYNCIHLN